MGQPNRRLLSIDIFSLPDIIYESRYFEREEPLVLRVEDEHLIILSLKDAAIQAQRLVQSQTKGLSLVDQLSKMRKSDYDSLDIGVEVRVIR